MNRQMFPCSRLRCQQVYQMRCGYSLELEARIADFIDLTLRMVPDYGTENGLYLKKNQVWTEKLSEGKEARNNVWSGKTKTCRKALGFLDLTR